MDANSRTGEKIKGERTEDDGVHGAYGRDELNNNGKRFAELRHRQQTCCHEHILQHAQRRHLAHLQRCHRGLRWRLQAHRLHSNTPGTPTESTQRRSTPATKLADQSGLGPQHDACHRGSWGTICPQSPCTADTATSVIRQKPAEDEIPPGARDPEIR